MNLIRKLLSIVFCSTILVGCQNQASKALSTKPLSDRWYSEAQVAGGKILFLNNCASCHKADASGTQNWKSLDSNGDYPPPPLNGTAHTWHHSMDVLRRTIQRGGVALGGVMPGFSETLKITEIDEVIAFFQSTWAEEKYSAWIERNQ